MLLVALVMFSRWEQARAKNRAIAAQQAEKQRAIDRAAVDQLGGKDFSILDFYASPKAIHVGESAQLCYGVSNAKTVTLQPQSNPVWPSPSHCVDVSPIKTTTYTLTITDVAGHSQSQALDLAVR